MQRPILPDQVGYGLSPDLWKNFPVDDIISHHDRNVGIGFFEDFDCFSDTTLEDGWLRLTGTGCTIAQIADEANAYGMVRLALDGNAANDEAVLVRGNGLSAPFYLTNYDLVWECRFRVSAITAAKWSIGCGLGQVDIGTTDYLFVDTTGAAADKNMVGFFHLAAEGAAWDGAYRADGQTYQDGAVRTALDSLHTMVAATFVKMGMRYRASSNSLHWYVNGVEKANIGAGVKTAATFPDDVFLTPFFGAKDIGGDAGLNVDVDWIACAQMCA